MANPHRGEIEFEAGGKTFALRYSVNAICDLEVLLGKGFVDITDEMATWSPDADEHGNPKPETAEETVARWRRIRAGTVRAVFWASLHNCDKTITLERAGDVMSEIGGVQGALIQISRSLRAAMPDRPPEPVQTNPAPAAPGTGPASP